MKWIENLYQHLIEKRAAKIKGEYTDVRYLLRKNLIVLNARGSTIKEVYVELQNKVDCALLVKIPPGTFLVSEGNYQNMLIRKEAQLTIAAGESMRINLAAVCLNALLPIPSERNTFTRVGIASPQIVKYLEATQGEDAMTVQAGVWAISDGLTAEQVKSRLTVRQVYSEANGRFVDRKDLGSPIFPRQIEIAREYLLKLKIPNRL